MPRLIVKPVSDEDFYVEWSTIIDGPIAWGDREEMIRELTFGIGDEYHSLGEATARLDRADKTGTSMVGGSWYAWDEDEFVYQHWSVGLFMIPRRNVRELCTRLLDKETEGVDISDITTPITHEEDENE